MTRCLDDTPGLVDRLRHPELQDTNNVYHQEVTGRAADRIEAQAAAITVLDAEVDELITERIRLRLRLEAAERVVEAARQHQDTNSFKNQCAVRDAIAAYDEAIK